MAQKLLVVPQVGEVILTKRRGSNNIRLSINAAGQVRVGMPYWTPYEAGLLFVKKHKDWIQKQLQAHAPKHPTMGSKIGKKHWLIMIKDPTKKGVKIQVTSTVVAVTAGINAPKSVIHKKVLAACERALKEEAGELLPRRVESISRKHKLPYRSLKTRKLTSRWGSCSSKKDITLSYFLIQLPWELIDYVILHELAHTVYHNHSRNFWGFMEERVRNLSDKRKQIKAHKPRIEPY